MNNMDEFKASISSQTNEEIQSIYIARWSKGVENGRKVSKVYENSYYGDNAA
ncbi:hypothetical protein CHS0354_018814 [Potamilus streckersoni]|uniref:Uncharacterized protein n=1 Tax=Potamilus streckersoni TaxID=2493646 RepID=A0AAE0WES2_9BIVA|nr:hypothetical protein CHS0354_018814 [Potamilus streckersoni]